MKARELGLVLVTEDKRFGRMVMRDAHPTAGIVPLRIAAWDIRTQQIGFKKLLTKHSEDLSPSLTILRPNSLRLRDFRNMPKPGTASPSRGELR